MDKQPLVSVIIPVYNVEKYLEKCVTSVVAQTYKNLEIVLVDDGSPDRSGKMCDDMAKLDNRIKVIHKKNEGLNYARRDGFFYSKGEWITFVDSDDAVHPQTVEILLREAEQHNVELAIGGFSGFADGHEIENNKIIKPEVIYEPDTDKVVQWLLRGSPRDNIFIETAWGKLYKKELLDCVDWKFCNYRANEDEFMAIQYYPNLKNGAVIVPENMYYYRENNNSITRKKFKNQYNGKDITKFETIEHLYQKSLKKMDKKFHDDILLRFVKLFFIFLERYAMAGQLDESVFGDVDAYFRPKIGEIEKVTKGKLREDQTELLAAAKDKGVLGFFETRMAQIAKHREEITSHCSNVENSLSLAQKEVESLRDENEKLRGRIEYLTSYEGIIKSPIVKLKQAVGGRDQNKQP